MIVADFCSTVAFMLLNQWCQRTEGDCHLFIVCVMTMLIQYYGPCFSILAVHFDNVVLFNGCVLLTTVCFIWLHLSVLCVHSVMYSVV